MRVPPRRPAKPDSSLAWCPEQSVKKAYGLRATLTAMLTGLVNIAVFAALYVRCDR